MVYHLSKKQWFWTELARERKDTLNLKRQQIAGKQIGKELMEELVSHVCLSRLVLSVVSSNKLVSLSWARGMWWDSFPGGIYVFKYSGKDKKLIAYLSFLYFSREWSILEPYSDPLQSRGGVESEGLKSIIHKKPKKIKPPSLRLPLFCRLMQIQCVYKWPEGQPCREKKFLMHRQSSTSVMVSDIGVST